VASGAVSGQLAWRGNPLFRVHENDGLLRAVTTDYNQSPPLHRLSILQQQGADLVSIATLPNTSLPQAIGKPGEDIYAVRFVDEKAYVVTFRNIDPLYVINLSDDFNPYIEGELEIPGFSSYIQPLENGYLLGVGQQVSAQDLPQVSIGPIVTPQNDGMKISLFDVRDPTNPVEVTKLVKENAFTPVEYDYKALSVLNINGAYQFALPIEEWGDFGTSLSSGRSINYRNSLMLLQTDTTSTAPELALVDTVSPTLGEEFYYYASDDRSVIQGNKVYYLHGNEVWLSDWSQAGSILGPF
jgi:hypothetical protein